MSETPRFAYSQARLQSRHGDRLDAAGWRRLAGVGDLLQLLQTARAGALRPWVLTFTEHTDMHGMELELRRRYREYVLSVTSWQPAAWRDAVRWTRRLPDLAAIRHLLSGETVWPWMRKDEALLPFVAEQKQARIEALRASECAPLVQAWQADETLLDGWLAHWRELWPDRARRLCAPLERLSTLLRQHVDVVALAPSGREADGETERLHHYLEVGFRRYTRQPATAFFHLGLIAVDMAILRGELARHRLFDVPRQDAN